MDVDSNGVAGGLQNMLQLQWSHVLMDVDRPHYQGRAIMLINASMEPRPDGRG